MDHTPAFLQAIREHPDDDLHRLAYADWLDDDGKPDRAAFVRAQLRLAHLPADDPARDALLDESDDLLARHEADWVGPLAELALDWRWHRGCLEHVTLWADALLARGDELFARAAVRSVRLLAEAQDFPRLAGCPHLASLEAIDLGTKPPPGSHAPAPFFRDRALLPLFVSPHLGRLRRLRLSGLGLEGAVVQALLDTGLFARLERLDLHGNNAIGDRVAHRLAQARAPALRGLHLLKTNLTSAGLRALLAAPGWPAMAELEVNAGLFFARPGQPPGVEALLESPLTPRLELLHLERVVLDRLDLDRLLGSPSLGPLRQLRLIGCRLSGDDAITLAESPALRGLRRLELADNLLFDQGARAVAASSYLGGLEALGLANNRVGGPGLRAVAASLGRLTELDLSGNYVGTGGAEVLAAKGPPRLERLRLDDADLGPDAARALAASPRLGRLRALGLSSNRISDAGAQALAASPHLARLRELGLDSNGIDSPGARALLASPHLANVRQLGLRNSLITAEERERLRARFGAGTAV